MNESKSDVYFLVFAAIVLFVILLSFIFFFFSNYRKSKRKHFLEREILLRKFSEDLLQSRLDVQEQAFNAISQEIHDNVGQVLSLAKIQINIMNESEKLSKELLNEVKQNISKALADLRDISKSLSTDRVRFLNIYDVFSNEVDRINKFGIVKATITAQGSVKDLEDRNKLILFRILQEIIQNIIKHAGASEIFITFFFELQFVEVLITDNGKGFDTNQIFHKDSGQGLLNIKTRAALVGGNCIIDSQIDFGTKTKIRIPYE
ncbi:MAG TPA: ATP-binding protein [Chitinophagaceae bacterium]|nr:ATP-binding protein [Chitinophagaceae bacterium]